MGMGTDESLVHMAHQVDEEDGVAVEVELLIDGRPLRGRLISEVRYRQHLADTVRRGNAASCADAYDTLTRAAAERREARRQRRQTHPHKRMETPDCLYLVEHPDWSKAWCVRLDAITAWSMTSLNVDLPEPGVPHP